MKSQLIAAGVTTALMLTGSTHPASTTESTSPIDDLAAVAAETVTEESLAEQLADEGIELSALETHGDVMVADVDATLADGEDYTTSTEVDLGEAIAEVEITSDDGTIDRSYTFQILDFDGDRMRLIVSDQDSGEVTYYDSAEGVYSAAPALVLGIPLAVAVLEKLLIAALVIVVVGVTYIAATQAIDAIRSKPQGYNHYVARRQPGGLFLGKALSLNEAISRGRSSGDTWSTTKAGARAVAGGVKAGTPVGPERDSSGAGKHCHYHPANRTPAMHAFYGTALSAC